MLADVCVRIYIDTYGDEDIGGYEVVYGYVGGDGDGDANVDADGDGVSYVDMVDVAVCGC